MSSTVCWAIGGSWAGESSTLADLMLAPQLYYLAATAEGVAILRPFSHGLAT